MELVWPHHETFIPEDASEVDTVVVHEAAVEVTPEEAAILQSEEDTDEKEDLVEKMLLLSKMHSGYNNGCEPIPGLPFCSEPSWYFPWNCPNELLVNLSQRSGWDV